MIIRDQYFLFHARRAVRRMHGVLLSCAMIVLALVMTLPPGSTCAAERSPLVLTGPADVKALSQHFEYTTDPDWQLKVGDFVDPATLDMRPVVGPVPDFGYTTAKIWLRLPIVNGTSRVNDWRFLVQIAFTQQIAIYKIGADGKVTTLLDLREDSPFSARPVSYPQIVAPFDLEPGEAATIVVSYHSLGASRHSMSIETPDSFAARAGISAAKNYAFYGMMLVMIALATVALVTLRQAVFAAYAAYLSATFLYVAHADGMAFQYFWPDFPQFNSMAASVTGSGVLVFGGLFAMSFLQTARYHHIMHRVLQAVVAAVLALDVVLWATDPKLLNRLLVYMALVSVLSFLIAGLVAARTRFREVRFYVFAWGAALIPACLFTARFAFGIEPAFITPYDMIRLALVVDALMMGLALFDRYNRFRLSALEESLAHAQRNVALGQRLAILEERYEQATVSARQREESVKDTVHDLRQPMHALRLSLRQMFIGDADNTTDVGKIETALGYMEKLVAEKLADKPGATDDNSSRLHGQPSDNGNDEPGLHGVLSGIADMFAAEAAEKGLELRLVLASPDARVAAYPLMRVVANLVSNAIKYTREGRVLIALRRSSSGHRVEVHDTGPGLNGADFEQALLRDQRLERDLSAAGGSGLGLAVVKEIVLANHWAITSWSARRRGASIRVEIPNASNGLPSGEDQKINENGAIGAYG